MEATVDKSVLEDSDFEDMPSGRKLRWKDRIGLVEQMAQECADSGRKFEVVLSSIRISQFAFYASLMPVKQKTALKKEVQNRVKDILYSRESADVGDVVRVPKYKDNLLLGGYIRDGRKLVEAVIISKNEDGSVQLRDNLSFMWCACGNPAVHYFNGNFPPYQFKCIKCALEQA